MIVLTKNAKYTIRLLNPAKVLYFALESKYKSTSIMTIDNYSYKDYTFEIIDENFLADRLIANVWKGTDWIGTANLNELLTEQISGAFLGETADLEFIKIEDAYISAVCTCELFALMNIGCQCGAFTKERKI